MDQQRQDVVQDVAGTTPAQLRHTPCVSILRYFTVNTLKEHFEMVDFRNISAFIKDINFYRYI